MSIAEKTVGMCPVCGQKSLVTHCPEDHPTCNWHACRNKDCDAVLDLTLGVGHCKVLGDPVKRRNVDLPKAAP